MTTTSGPAPAAVDLRAAPLELSVRAVSAGNRIRTLTLGSPDGSPLPPFGAGSHLVVHAGAVRNAYSLVGDGTAPQTYQISVLVNPVGAGGSRWLHGLATGDLLRADRPRCAFGPVSDAKRHLLIAGGIGITAVLGHLSEARRWGRPVSIVYAHRAGRGAHLEQVRELGRADLVETGDAAQTMRAVEQQLLDSPLGTHIYVCGPTSLMDAVLDRARALGWSAQPLNDYARCNSVKHNVL